MMTLLLYTHIVSALGLLAGVIARNIALGFALRAVLLTHVQQHVGMAGWFERVLVIPGSNLVFVSGLALAWLKGWPILGFLQGGPGQLGLGRAAPVSRHRSPWCGWLAAPSTCSLSPSCT